MCKKKYAKKETIQRVQTVLRLRLWNHSNRSPSIFLHFHQTRVRVTTDFTNTLDKSHSEHHLRVLRVCVTLPKKGTAMGCQAKKNINRKAQWSGTQLHTCRRDRLCRSLIGHAWHGKESSSCHSNTFQPLDCKERRKEFLVKTPRGKSTLRPYSDTVKYLGVYLYTGKLY